MIVGTRMFWVHDEAVTVCRMRQSLVVDCSTTEHRQQRRFDLQQLHTVTGEHPAARRASDNRSRRLDMSDERRRSAARYDGAVRAIQWTINDYGL